MKNTAFSLMTALLAVMNESEPKDPYYVLAQYFLYHFDQLRDLNIYDVADACYVSRSGIRRFCQSIGFDNFSDLKAEADEWKRQCNYFIGYSVRPDYKEHLSGSIGEMMEEIKTAIAQKGEGSASKGRIVLATVKGDVHDIGKNIVRVILENYGFEVLDLGRDVPVETVVDTVREKDVHLVGLSALMTTTLKSMEETIAALHAAKLDCKIMVGGAVLTPEYAEKIGADWYAKDAKRSADIAKEFFGV